MYFLPFLIFDFLMIFVICVENYAIKKHCVFSSAKTFTGFLAQGKTFFSEKCVFYKYPIPQNLPFCTLSYRVLVRSKVLWIKKKYFFWKKYPKNICSFEMLAYSMNYEYNCEICNYSTKDKSNYRKHLKTSKHIDKSIEVKQNTTSVTNNQISEKVDSEICEKKVIFSCKVCGKKYSNRSNLNRHFKRNNHDRSTGLSEVLLDCGTKKYKSNPNLQISENPIQSTKTVIKLVRVQNNICMYCSKVLSSKHSRIRHEETCSKKEGFLLRSKIDQTKNIDGEYFDKKIEYYRNVIGVAGGLAAKAVSSMSHVVNNYSDAPAIRKLTIQDIRSHENFKYCSTKNYEDKMIDQVLYAYNNGNIGEYVGDIIVGVYKKQDPMEQSIWTTDTSRLTYVIKKHVGNKVSEWTIDKKGYETIKMIIEPITRKIRKLAVKYINEICPDLGNIQDYGVDKDHIMKLTEMCCGLIKDIDDGKVQKKILKYIAAHLHVKKDKQRLKNITDSEAEEDIKAKAKAKVKVKNEDEGEDEDKTEYNQSSNPSSKKKKDKPKKKKRKKKKSKKKKNKHIKEKRDKDIIT